MLHVPPRHILSAALIGIVLVSTGCSDKDTTNTTVVADNNAIGSVFGDGTSAQLQDNPWQNPTVGLTYHEETATDAWAIQAVALASARPGADQEDFIADRSQSNSSTGSILFQSRVITNGDGDSNFPVVERIASNFRFYDDITLLAHGKDNVIYQQDGDTTNEGKKTWKTELPASAAKGTAWNVDLGQIHNGAYVYRSVGAVNYRPVIQTKTVAPDSATNGHITKDANLEVYVVAVDASGVTTADPKKVAVALTSGTGYEVTAVNVSKVGRFVVTNEDTTSPGGIKNVVEVSLTYDFRIDAKDVKYDSVIGLEKYSASYKLYWKKKSGWVEWTGTETSPSFGLNGITSPLNTESYSSLSLYNANYDTGLYGTDGSSYRSAWQEGYQYAYTDASTSVSASDRLSLADALNEYLDDNNLSDGDLLDDSNDNGLLKGKRLAAEAGFRAGYALGETYYDADYTAVTSASDTLKTGQSNRSWHYWYFESNMVPAMYRRGGNLKVENLEDYDIDSVVDDISANLFTNGVDGLGVVVTPYVGTTLDTLTVKKNEFNQEKQVYISLPVVGQINTSTISGRQTDVKIGDDGKVPAAIN